MNKSPAWPATLSAQERAEQAKLCVKATIKRITEVVDLDEIEVEVATL